MKCKAAVSGTDADELGRAFSDEEFGGAFLDDIVAGVFKVEDPRNRPAEYYTQEADFTISLGPNGVEVRLTGVSRGNREPKIFHDAIKALKDLVVETAMRGLSLTAPSGPVQCFVVMMIDGEIPTPPGLPFAYTSVIELPAFWVDANGIVEESTSDQLELEADTTATSSSELETDDGPPLVSTMGRFGSSMYPG